MLNTLIEMFSYTFLVRAVVVGLLVSLCASLLGVSLVLKRYSMIGDGLSHVGFGTLAIATAMNAAPLTVSIPIVVLAAFLLLRISENSKIKGDAAIALISTGSLALGVMVISLTTGMNTDVCNYLFGSILAMRKDDVVLSLVLAGVVLVLFILFYNKIFAVTFDENFARATGVKTNLYNMLIAFLTAITIVLGMRMMGALLISSLLIFPALTSMRVCKRFQSVTIFSAFISVICFFIGVVLSYIWGTPTGASVVIVNIFAFLIFWAIGFFKERGKKLKTPVFAAAAMFMLIAFSACGSTAAQELPSFSATASKVYADTETSVAAEIEKTTLHAQISFTTGLGENSNIVEIKEKLFVAQTNDIYLNFKDYLGKTIRYEGIFQSENWEGNGNVYHYVIRYGPGCCGTDADCGFEVLWKDPETAYPQLNDWVRCEGVLEQYEEDGSPYLRLSLNSLQVLSTRGAETVSQ
jgi:zinc transport system permease protein